MTEPTPDPLDDLASAHLDGESTAEEAARVAADADAAARVERFAAVRRALRADLPGPPAEAREANVAAALATYDQRSDPSAAVVTLQARARRRWGTAVLAAAAVVLLALLVPAVLDDGDDPQTTADQLAIEADDAAGTTMAPTGDLGAAAGRAGEDASTMLEAGPPVPVDLGSHPDAEALAAGVRHHLDAPPVGGVGPAPGSTSSPALHECLARLLRDTASDDRPVVLTGQAVVGNRPVAFVVEIPPNGVRTLVIAGLDDDCSLVDRIALDERS